MKTRSIARGIVGSVAALLGVMAAGCSAETGEPEAAEIGSTAQALSNTNVVNQSHAFDNAGTDASIFGSACEVDDPASGSSAKFMIAVGGLEDNSGNYSDDAVLYKPGVGYDANARTTFTDGRAFGFLIKDPTDSKSCLYIGGEKGNGKVDQIVKLTVSKPNSTYVLTATDAGLLTVARSHVQAVKMGSKVLIFGGFTGNNGVYTPSDVMDVWNGESDNLTTIATFKNKRPAGSGGPQTVTLNVARGNFAADVSAADATHILLGGGEGASAALDSIEAIDVDANGDLDSTSATHPVNVTTSSPSARTKLSAARSGLGAVYASASGSVETWIFGLGNASGTATAAIDSVNVDWSNFGSTSNTAPVDACASTNLVAAANPLVVKMASNRLVFVGGTGTGENAVQEYNAGTCTSTTTDSSSTNLVKREGSLGTLVDGHVYYTAGRDASTNPDTLHTTTFKVN